MAAAAIQRSPSYILLLNGYPTWLGVTQEERLVAVLADVRSLGEKLERSYEVYVRDRLKFRVGPIVYVAFSLDESEMGFAFPREERAALVLSQPQKFRLPS